MAPFAHILAGFTLGFRCRRELARILAETSPAASILTIDPAVLKDHGIAALAIDFDGVLAGHGAPVPLPEAVAWMQRCLEVFGGEQMFILSNKPTEGRRRWFADHFPSLRFISGVRKKPYPDGLKKTGELAGVPLHAILMIDDRLLTGCLAAVVSGARPCYIRRPYVTFSHRPAAELFFRLLRSAERLYVRVTSLL